MQATCATEAGDPGGAEALAEEALLLAGEPSERARERVVGDRRGQKPPAGGDAADADAAYGEALELLAAHGTVREHAAVLRSYGRFLRDGGRELEALDVFERAAEVAANLQSDPAGAER